MTKQELRELFFIDYRHDIDPTLPENEQLQECERCEGVGATPADRAADKHFGRCEPCFGTGYQYPGDDAVNQRLMAAYATS